MSVQSTVLSESSVRHLNVLHVISGLGTGGAESMLYRLIKANQEQSIQSVVICLGEESFVADKIRALDVEILNLEFHRYSVFNLTNLRRIIQITRRANPDVIQGWMYHGNFVATVIKLVLARRSKLFWNVRQTIQSLRNEKTLTRWVIRINSLLSRCADSIIYNSTLSRSQHESFGFKKCEGNIVYNGISLDEYGPSTPMSSKIRSDLGIDENAIVIGHVARYHPKKDHRSLIEALSDKCFDDMKLVFLLVGKAVDVNNRDLQSLILETGLNKKIMLLGEREDVPNLFKCMDILVSSSAWGEGFPNVLIEAMATEVYCISTDVGESKNILADCGVIIPPKDVPALTQALLKGILLPVQSRNSIGKRAREIVSQHYSIAAIGDHYRQLYIDAVDGNRVSIDC